MATARRFRRDVRLRFGGLAMPCFHCFAAHGGMRFHPALQFDRRTYPTTALNCVVRYSNFGHPMSALGQKRTSEHVQSMSALPPTADIGTEAQNVRYVPKADIRRPV